MVHLRFEYHSNTVPEKQLKFRILINTVLFTVLHTVLLTIPKLFPMMNEFFVCPEFFCQIKFTFFTYITGEGLFSIGVDITSH